MIINDASRARWVACGRILDHLPDDLHVYVNDGPCLQLTSTTQKELRSNRALFPGVFWEKSYEAWCKTWYYCGYVDGVQIMLSCSEAPPTCTKVVKKKYVLKKVPVQFEEREVEEEEISYDCGGDGGEEESAA